MAARDREPGARPVSLGPIFETLFVAAPEDIDVMGHVNNAVWVRWVQETATRHWNAVARPEDQARYAWLVTRHEIDYRGNIEAGEEAVARTWLPHPPKGARFERRVEFGDAAGKVLVSATTIWAMIDRKSGRPARITSEVIEPFRGQVEKA